jgi:4-amino-4-deoxy-L-arabinose transferase-like glycosyltransferase
MESNQDRTQESKIPQDLTPPKSTLAEFLNKPFFSSRIFEVLLFCIIIGLAFAAGVFFLDSDPPRISWSQDVATDPPQYTYFARNKVLWGSWDLYGHNRFVFFLKSFCSVVSYVVFLLFGTGRAQANLVAVILNILTMVFLFLGLKKVFNKRAAFFSLFFLAINFVFVMYGRNPFLEFSALFLLTLGFYFLVSSLTKKNLLIPSGICFAAGIFFGKTMAAFILPACFGFLLLWMFQHHSSSEKKVEVKPLILFSVGFLAITLFWTFFSYLPAKREVAGYLSEQALGLYGFPLALQSVWGFVSALFTFGSDIFYRMPIVFALSLIGLLLFFQDRSSLKRLIRKRDDRSKTAFFLAFWFLTAFFLLMILNYKPLRYQIYLIPPMCALAGIWLDSFVNSSGSKKHVVPGILFWIAFLVAVTFFTNYVITMLHKLSQRQILLNTSLPISLVITLLGGSLFYLRSVTANKRAKTGNRSINMGSRLLIALAFLLVSFVINLWQYSSWAFSPTYSLNRASVDLGKILSKEAVVSGPYGPALVWDNDLRNVIHMFGVTQADPQLFLTYPITHLAVERNGNKDRAFKDYPEVMNKSSLITTYWLRNMPVEIYRIAEHTGNPLTKDYPLSDFERARLVADEGNADSALVMLENFVSQNPDNYSGYTDVTELYFNLGEYEKAALALKKAIQFNPTDFLIHQQLGAVYLNLGNQKRDDSYLLLAIEQWEEALKLFPQNTDLAAQLQRIKGN